MGKTLARFGLTLKKTLHASEQRCPAVAQARAAWSTEQAAQAQGRLIFLDETGAASNMTPTRGALSQRPAMCRTCTGWSLAQHDLCLCLE
jgi:hypothetical protein